MMNAVKDWRSTIAGVALVVTGAVQIHSTQDLANQNIFGNILGGIALILAQFPSKKSSGQS